MAPIIYERDEIDFEPPDFGNEFQRVHGQQQYKGELPTSDQVQQHVLQQKEKGKKWWWQCMWVVLATATANAPLICYLQKWHASCCVCTPQHVHVSATGQRGARCTQSCAHVLRWSAHVSSSMCAAMAGSRQKSRTRRSSWMCLRSRTEQGGRDWAGGGQGWGRKGAGRGGGVTGCGPGEAGRDAASP